MNITKCTICCNWTTTNQTSDHWSIASVHSYYYDICWTAFFQENLAKHSGFYWSKRWWGGSGISWTIRKSFAPRSRQITTPVPHHSVFTGQMTIVTPSQQRQGTEGKSVHSWTACWNLFGCPSYTALFLTAAITLKITQLCFPAKQVAMVWACAAKRRHWLGEEMYGIWGGGLQTKR